jgi:hypothetical protein
MYLKLPLSLVTGFLLLGSTPALRGDEKVSATAVPKEVRDLVGNYTGSWTMYGIDDKGAVVKKSAWTDTMKAVNPRIKGDRAFITSTDEMSFEGGTGKFKIDFTEGYFLNSDGSLGDYFVESFGQLRRLVKLSKQSAAYATPAAAQELTQLGFPKGAKGEHVLVKATTSEGGLETHRITRVTTVTWTDKDGKDRTLQYVSLQGYHKRVP